MDYRGDADIFLEWMREEDLSDVTKREARKMFFRIKKELTGRYHFEIDGYEENYEATLEAENGDVVFVLDVHPGEAEVNAFVLDKDDTTVNEVIRKKWSV